MPTPAWLVGPHLYVDRPENSEAVPICEEVAAVLVAALACGTVQGGPISPILDRVADLLDKVAALKAAQGSFSFGAPPTP